MQNVSTQLSRPLRIRTAVFLTILGLAAAAVAIELPTLVNGSAPATTSPATRTSVQAARAGPGTHKHSQGGRRNLQFFQLRLCNRVDAIGEHELRFWGLPPSATRDAWQQARKP